MTVFVLRRHSTQQGLPFSLYVYDTVGQLPQVTKDGAVVEAHASAGPGTGCTVETNALYGLANRASAYNPGNRPRPRTKKADAGLFSPTSARPMAASP
ncbi:hypothetical protein [Desulfovibrio sp. DV]|uniref:hypothetical protein n=1 Tax=Desulfovibrio sp. DV TaxID=1844708 RepID=UPI00094B8D46|nr:hypothetical protein [Desulfovibrio sp. DV]